MILMLSELTKASASKLHGDWSILKELSSGVSSDATKMYEAIRKLNPGQEWSRPSSVLPLRPRESEKSSSTAEQLHDALAKAKVFTSRVVMHLQGDWRERLFAQLDDLMDAEDWHEDDTPLKVSSFQTFLRMTIHQSLERRPGFGLSYYGNLIASWTTGKDRLTMEFLVDDTVKWVLACEVDGEVERAAGVTPVRRLPIVLGPYGPDRWFAVASGQDPL